METVLTDSRIEESALGRPDLFRQLCLVDGAWTDCGATRHLEVFNPATEKILGAVPSVGRKATAAAVRAAARAWPQWRRRTAQDRAAVMRGWQQMIVENTRDLSRIITAEQGKPLPESEREVLSAAGYVEWFAEESKRIYGDTIPMAQTGKRIVVMKEPVGVCAAITPWNFPLSMMARKVAPALAAGCPVIVKPSGLTPFSALALARLGELAGLPPGVLQVVTGEPEEVGRELASNPLVRKLSFTGSTAVGKVLMAQCASSVKKVSLELGGHAPFIVFEDADIECAAEEALKSKFRNSGQTCVCANRIYVHEAVREAFTDALVGRMRRQLKVGNGLEPGVTQGPLINVQAVRKVEAQIADALAKGASVICGGRRLPGPGFFFEPTVLSGVKEGMRITLEETFGPVAPIISFKDEEEVVAMANATPYGLAAYCFCRDIGRVWRMSEALEYGMVGINTGVMSSEAAPFGGIKESGFGREGSKYGMEEYLELKYVCLAGI